MEIRLTEDEVKYAVAIHLFTKMGMRLEIDDFHLYCISSDVDKPASIDGFKLEIKED